MSELWAHQKEAINRALNKNCFALLFQPGTGKTRTAIHILRNKYAQHGALLPTFIICPPIVIQNWKKEWLSFSKVTEDRIVTLTGTGKQRAATFRNSPMNSIFITNFETLLMDEVFRCFVQSISNCIYPVALVIDESHKCKDGKAKRTKRAIELSRYCSLRYILTGTPILNNLMDAFTQWQILDQGKAFGKNFFTFRARYFYDKNAGMNKQKYFPDWKPRPGAEEEIKRIMEQDSMHAEKSKCLDLPPLVRKIIEVPMGSDQARLYKSMKQDLIATLQTEDGKIHASIAELAITKALRLQQIVSGHLRVVEDGKAETRTLTIKDSPRKKALHDLLADLAPYHKVLVWAVFKDNYEDIKDVCLDLKLGFTELHGGTKDRDQSVHLINNDPKVRVLIGHPGSGGIGVNLTSASFSIFYSRSFSLEFDIQAEARNYRGGSECHEKITRIDLVTPGTIDELVLKSLASKQALNDRILKSHLTEI